MICNLPDKSVVICSEAFIRSLMFSITKTETIKNQTNNIFKA
jgi:hypothetical protein